MNRPSFAAESRALPIAPRPVARSLALTFLFLVPTLIPADAQEVPEVTDLSLAEALRIAHGYNPNYRIQENGLQPLDWQRREAWAGFFPSFNVSNAFGYTASGERVFGDFTLGTQPAQFSSRYSLSLSLGLNGATFLQPRATEAREDAMRAEVDGASANLIDQVTRTYLEALEAIDQLAQAQSEVNRTATYVAQAEAQETVGSATPLDVRRSDTHLGQARIQLLQAQNAVVTTRLSLGQAVGVPLPPGLELTSEFQLFEPEFDLPRLLAVAMANNPVLRARRSQASAARTQTRMTQTQYLPSLSLSAGWSGTVFEADDTAPLIQSRLAQVSGQYQSCIQDNRIRELLGDPLRDCSAFDVSDPQIQSTLRRQVIEANEGFPFDYDTQPLSLSLSLSLPVFNGFSRQVQIEEAQVAADN
ncbi:MAG: TolC family protein, partial [Gemmatimonadota bacterium]